MATGTYRFGNCRVCAGTREVFCDGVPVELAPKVFETLLHLIQHRDRVVTKDELLRTLWPGRVVEESNVTQAVYVLRRALSPGVVDSKLIATVARVGYRFLPEVVESRELPADAEKMTAMTVGTASQSLATTALSAAKCVERGRAQLAARVPSNLLAAIEWFRHALTMDPGNAQAYVELANSYSLLCLYGGMASPHETYPLARVAAQRALEIEPTLAAAYTALGVVQLFYDWDWDGAHRSFERAVELDATAAEPRYRWATCLLSSGNFEAARRQFEHAMRLDPLSPVIRTFASYTDYYLRRYDAAIVTLRKIVQLDPKFSLAHFRLGLALTHAGHYDEAITELVLSLQLSGGDKDVIAALAHARGKAGDIVGARVAMHELMQRAASEFTSGYQLAIAHLGLSENESALRHLELAVEQRSYWLIYIAFDPSLDPLRDEPRFIEVLERVRGHAASSGKRRSAAPSPQA